MTLVYFGFAWASFSSALPWIFNGVLRSDKSMTVEIDGWHNASASRAGIQCARPTLRGIPFGMLGRGALCVPSPDKSKFKAGASMILYGRASAFAAEVVAKPAGPGGSPRVGHARGRVTVGPLLATSLELAAGHVDGSRIGSPRQWRLRCLDRFRDGLPRPRCSGFGRWLAERGGFGLSRQHAPSEPPDCIDHLHPDLRRGGHAVVQRVGLRTPGRPGAVRTHGATVAAAHFPCVGSAEGLAFAAGRAPRRSEPQRRRTPRHTPCRGEATPSSCRSCRS